jgi:hypothetical protein
MKTKEVLEAVRTRREAEALLEYEEVFFASPTIARRWPSLSGTHAGSA